MTTYEIKKLLIVIGSSLVLSLCIIRWHSIGNISFCIHSAGCQFEDPKGTVTIRTYGFPLTYKQVSTFRPTNHDEKAANYAGYAEASIENQSFSILSVVGSAIFWFGLLHLGSRSIKPRQKTTVQDAPIAS